MGSVKDAGRGGFSLSGWMDSLDTYLENMEKKKQFFERLEARLKDLNFREVSYDDLAKKVLGKVNGVTLRAVKIPGYKKGVKDEKQYSKFLGQVVKKVADTGYYDSSDKGFSLGDHVVVQGEKKGNLRFRGKEKSVYISDVPRSKNLVLVCRGRKTLKVNRKDAFKLKYFKNPGLEIKQGSLVEVRGNSDDWGFVTSVRRRQDFNYRWSNDQIVDVMLCNGPKRKSKRCNSSGLKLIRPRLADKVEAKRLIDDVVKDVELEVGMVSEEASRKRFLSHAVAKMRSYIMQDDEILRYFVGRGCEEKEIRGYLGESSFLS
ncbi:MAG: hypothetical protein ABIB71_03905 [Candidatus Woesearchaeota archaeon]